MVRLALLATAAYAACRMTKAIIAENTERLLLPAPSIGNRPPKDASLASDPNRIRPQACSQTRGRRSRLRASSQHAGRHQERRHRMACSKTGTASIWSSPRLNNLPGTIRSPSAYARILALGGARRLDPASHCPW